MKKLFCMGLCLIVMLSLCACGGNSTKGKSNTDKNVGEIVKGDNSIIPQKESMLEKLYDSYIKYTSIGQPIEGKRRILSSKTNDDGVVTKIVYEKESDLSSDTTVTYNPDDNTITINDNWVIEFENNRPVSKTDSDGVVTTYTYNSDGNLAEIDAVIQKQTFEYLNNGKTVKKINKMPTFTNIYEYGYDDNGFLISLTIYYEDGDSLKHYYENDSEGRMLKTYTKNSSGEIESIIEENTYDEEGYLIS